ncbi:hypothetical protein BDZ91DRAFT_803613 [Kalaharituber pfeilii]|nr:hypothetical protein BDZ91DRAFT_803613 [Kalaharituber pfeilii]
MSTVNIRTWDQKNPKATSIYWTRPIQAGHPLPSLAFALTGFDASRTTDIHLSASYQWIEKGSHPTYNAILDSRNTIIYSATCSWLEIPANHPVLRTGTYNMTEPLTLADGPKHIPIQFSQPFIRKAKVAVFLNGIHFDKNHNWRVGVGAIDETDNGFTLKLWTWADTIVLELGVTWVAYPEGTPGITSGDVSTNLFRSWENPQPSNAWYKSFVGETAFGSKPRIFIGISSCDFWAGTSFRLATKVVEGPETNQYGFLWRADTWSDSRMYSTNMGYLAFDPNF